MTPHHRLPEGAKNDPSPPTTWRRWKWPLTTDYLKALKMTPHHRLPEGAENDPSPPPTWRRWPWQRRCWTSRGQWVACQQWRRRWSQSSPQPSWGQCGLNLKQENQDINQCQRMARSLRAQIFLSNNRSLTKNKNCTVPVYIIQWIFSSNDLMRYSTARISIICNKSLTILIPAINCES